ncbi:MAG: glycosyltransferase family 2 protein [Terrimicrobiaceae bacterium]
MDPDANDFLITLFVACFNESENISATLDVVLAACATAAISYEVIIIDDASTDGSVDVIRRYLAAHPQAPIRLHINEKNMGLGENFAEAAFMGRGKYYRLICGDNVEPVETLVKVFREIGKADIILSYRPDDVEGKSFARRITSSAFTKLVNLLSGYNIHYYNGLPIMKRRDVMRWQPNSHGFGFQADLVTRLLDRGATYIEVPVKGHERKKGSAKAINFRNFCSVAHSLLNIVIRRFSKFVYGHS